jgi:hypothetical protein
MRDQMADRSGNGKKGTKVSEVGRLVRDAGRIAVLSSELPAATVLTLAHRVPILWASSPSVWQQAELWHMSLEKPLALGAVWTALALAPLQVSLALARAWGSRGGAALPFALAALGTGAMSDAIGTVHKRVTRNARRLARRRAWPEATRRR